MSDTTQKFQQEVQARQNEESNQVPTQNTQVETKTETTTVNNIDSEKGDDKGVKPPTTDESKQIPTQNAQPNLDAQFNQFQTQPLQKEDTNTEIKTELKTTQESSTPFTDANVMPKTEPVDIPK